LSEYLSFKEDDHYEGKTKRIIVINKRHLDILGEIKWYRAWRQYTFYPVGNTVWNRQCLDDIITYINNLMDERKISRNKKI
jgi:hypothetical protein